MSKYKEFAEQIIHDKRMTEFNKSIWKNWYMRGDDILKLVNYEHLPRWHENYIKISEFCKGETIPNYKPTVKDIAHYLSLKYNTLVHGASICIHINILLEPVIQLASAWSVLDKTWVGKEIEEEFGITIPPIKKYQDQLFLINKINMKCRLFLKELHNIEHND